jgi:hypothetical protein
VNAKDCRRVANEFLRSAEQCRDNLDERLGWLLLSNVWFSLAERLDQAATNAAEKYVKLGDRLREGLAI